jgi:hypothetical protein
MTSRELRKQRREKEREARKLAYRQSRAAALAPNPDLFDEFSAKEQAEMMAVRARVHAGAGLTSYTGAKNQGRPGPGGPRSPEGKAISSGNSLKHGLASGRVIIPGEDPAEFEALLQDLIAEHTPAGETEQLLVQHMAQSWWLMQRAIRIQNQAFTETRVDTHKLALFLRYQTTHERAFYRALNSLIKLKKEAASSRRSSAAGFVSQKRDVKPPSSEFVSQQPAARAPGSVPDPPALSISGSFVDLNYPAPHPSKR